MASGPAKVQASDLRELPAYSIPEAAHYLRLPRTTLRSWVLGQPWRHRQDTRRGVEPLITLASRDTYTLSFSNMVECHVLKAMRRVHKIPMQRIRRALDWLHDRYPSPHPLLDRQFATDGLDLFIEYYGNLLKLDAQPQLLMRSILEKYLARIERDRHGIPIKLFPFTRPSEDNDPGSIEIDASIAFGRPVLRGTGIPTQILAERYAAGESVDHLAEDYGRSREEIEEAIRCELALQAA